MLPDCTPGGLPGWQSAHELNCVLASVGLLKALSQEWSFVFEINPRPQRTVAYSGPFVLKNGGMVSVQFNKQDRSETLTRRCVR